MCACVVVLYQMRKFIYHKCWKCKPLDDEPLIVSGRGDTEYEITFCKDCGRVISKITKDFENLYSYEVKNKRR